MPIITKKYLWRFLAYFLSGYLLGMIILYIIDSLLKTNIRDIPIVLAISYAIPFSLSNRFYRKEGRLFTNEERQRMIRKGTWIAWAISILPNIFCIGYCLFVKLVVPADQIPGLLQTAEVASDSSIAALLEIPTSFLSIMLLAAGIIYYIAIWFFVSRGFKHAAKHNKRMHSDVVHAL